MWLLARAREGVKELLKIIASEQDARLPVDAHASLERGKFRSISGIAYVSKIILGLARGEITRERSDPAAQARNCPLRHLTQVGLELAKRHLGSGQIGEYCGR